MHHILNYFHISAYFMYAVTFTMATRSSMGDVLLFAHDFGILQNNSEFVISQYRFLCLRLVFVISQNGIVMS